MTAPDAVEGYVAQLEDGTTFRNEVVARFALQIVRYVPGRSLRQVRCPVLLCLCAHDTVAPPRPSRRFAAQGSDVELTEHPYGHFDIYRGEAFAAVLADQRGFLRRRVPVAEREDP